MHPGQVQGRVAEHPGEQRKEANDTAAGRDPRRAREDRAVTPADLIEAGALGELLGQAAPGESYHHGRHENRADAPGTLDGLLHLGLDHLGRDDHSNAASFLEGRDIDLWVRLLHQVVEGSVDSKLGVDLSAQNLKLLVERNKKHSEKTLRLMT